MRPAGQRGVDLVPFAADLGASSREGTDDGKGDQRRQQRIFDRCDAACVSRERALCFRSFAEETGACLPGECPTDLRLELAHPVDTDFQMLTDAEEAREGAAVERQVGDAAVLLGAVTNDGRVELDGMAPLTRQPGRMSWVPLVHGTDNNLCEVSSG